ncbi:MAG: SIMPL domain-containing protein, partial [Pseudomonadales bacterium]
ILLLGSVFLLGCSESAVSDDDYMPTVSTSATGELHAIPDIAVINGRVQEQAKDAGEAMAAARKQLDQVIEYVKTQGIAEEDLQAAQILVQAQWHYPRNEPRQLTGYQANASFTIKLRDTAGLSQIYGGVIKAGANTIDSVSFEFSNYDELELQAIGLAVEKAQRKAAAGLAPLGQKVGKVVSMQVDTHWQPQPMPRGKMMAMEASSDAMAAPAQINVGNQPIKATVSVSFIID